MHKVISLEDALKLDNPLFVDMRSPSEYRDGKIPGAINIPLLDDLERSEVGTIYKQVNPEEARQRGLSIVSIKLPDIVSTIRDHYKAGRTVIVYCWRGGMRSKSVVNILELMGIPAYQLIGGYKAFRRHVLDRLADFPLKPEVVVLCGSTGVGKTTLLNMLSKRGIPVIDLEKLANHRGSAFGHVGLGRPETAQNFDALILQLLERFNDQPYILVECESKRVGNVYLPDVLYQAMQRGKKILAYTDVDTRIERLRAEYLDVYQQNSEGIMTSIKNLKPRLGTKKTEALLAAFAESRIDDVVRTLLVDYYDPLYGYEKAAPTQFDFLVDVTDLEQASAAIINFLNTLRGN